jgi:hypothetical protein
MILQYDVIKCAYFVVTGLFCCLQVIGLDLLRRMVAEFGFSESSQPDGCELFFCGALRFQWRSGLSLWLFFNGVGVCGDQYQPALIYSHG